MLPLLVVALSLAAGAPQHRQARQHNLDHAGEPTFAFAPAGSGVGLPYASTLCDALAAADKVGAWWCLAGDGTMSTGSQVTLTASGSPAAAAARSVCPNGPSCSTATMQRFDGVDDKYESGNVASPTGDATTCYLGTTSEPDGAWSLLTGKTGAGANPSVQMWSDSSAVPRFTVWKDGASSTALVSSTASVLRTHHLICLAYDFISDGASVLKGYLDGVEVATSSIAVGPLTAASTPWFMGYNKFGAASYHDGLHRGSFMVETYLSAARIAQLARAVLADTPTGTKGEALTFTRATASSCGLDANETEITYLPSGRPCITRGGLSVYRAGTNLCLQSETLDNASWANVGTPTVTANAELFVDGALVMETIADNDGAGFEGRSQAISTTSQTQHTFSVWLGCASGACEASVTTVGTGNAAGDTTCNFTGLTTASVRKSCTTAAYGAGLTAVTVAIRSGDGAADQYTIKAGGAQYEVAATYASPYVRTTTASVTRNPEAANFAGLSLGSGPKSGAATRTGQRTQTAYYLGVNVSSGNRAALYQVGNSNDLNCWGAGVGVLVNRVGATGSADRVACGFGAVDTTGCMNGSCGTGAADTLGAVNAVSIGYDGTSGTLQIDGIISDVCVDGSPLRCR